MIPCETAQALRSLETIHFGSEYCGQPFLLRKTGNTEMKMNDQQATRLETAESNVKQLMADVSRAMEKVQEAIARVTSTVGPPLQERNPRVSRVDSSTLHSR
jgi:hypothetical protein